MADLNNRINKMKIILINCLKFIIHYSGFEYIYRKFVPEKSLILPTGFIWFIIIYVALFVVASQRYENNINRLENRTNSILSLIVKDEIRDTAVRFIPKVQNTTLPLEPKFLNPYTTFLSLFSKKSEYHKETIEILKGTIVGFKFNLQGAYLSDINLSGADLSGANLRESTLEGAKLIKTDLRGANMEGAKLVSCDLSQAHLTKANLNGADLSGAIMNETYMNESTLEGATMDGAKMLESYLDRANLGLANLVGTDLERANLKNADLRGANMEGAKNLTIEQLCLVKTLYQSIFNDELKKQVNEICPQLLLEEHID